MKSAIVQILTRPAAGPAFAGVSLVLALGLGLSLVDASRARADYVAQTADLSRALEAERSASALMVARPTAPAAKQGTVMIAEHSPEADAAAVAERLANEPPAGLDGCARMESADQAVLATLR